MHHCLSRSKQILHSKVVQTPIVQAVPLHVRVTELQHTGHN